MKKWIIIVVIVGLLGWAVYDFTIGNSSDNGAASGNFAEGENATGDGNDAVGLGKGQLAPDFELETLGGEKVKLSDFRGEKVIVNFWATWCPPCRSEMPDMQKFHEETGATILAVNLFSTEQGKKNVESFLDEYGVTFTVLAGKEDEVSTLYR